MSLGSESVWSDESTIFVAGDASISIRDSSFCRNGTEPINGVWSDLGGNCFGAKCCGGGLELSFSSSCPETGPATLTATGGSGGSVAFFRSQDFGNISIPGGRACSGTYLNLGSSAALIGVATGNPAVFDIADVGAIRCGITYGQSIDLDTCDVSNTVLFE